MTAGARQELVSALPYARRFARALSRDQREGDALVAAALADREALERADLPARLALYGRIAAEFEQKSGQKTGESGKSAIRRALLLLTSLEEQSIASAAKALGLPEAQAASELAEARAALQRMAQTSVLIIEDEPVIALDIQDLVERCGHRVAGIAHTEADAVRLAAETKPGLILADINLGGGGDGMSAVRRILEGHETPVIFVTAYPERLLTGEAHEPSFVITKPFEPMALAVATFQAVTGGAAPI